MTRRAWLNPNEDEPYCSGIADDPLLAGEITEHDNPVVGVLYAPDGEPLITITERRTVPFGYQRQEPAV